jgi:hypothetical protein
MIGDGFDLCVVNRRGCDSYRDSDGESLQLAAFLFLVEKHTQP